MTYFCIPIIGPTIEDAILQISESHAFANLYELRLDLWHSYSFENLQCLKEGLKVPIVFTLRKKSQGGAFEGSEEERLQEISRLATLHPDYIDLEYDISSSFIEKLASEFPKVQLIISFHDFCKTPSNLESLLQSMKHPKVTLYKIACHANSTNDSLKMLTLIKKHAPLLGMCMGEKGAITRILGPMFGSPWTFACISESHKTAPGQLTVSELTSTYALDRLSQKSAIYGLIGGTITQSISHQTHNKIFQECGIDAVYVKMVVEKEELEEFFKLTKHLQFKGLSVTIPLKEQVISYIDYLDEKSKKIGAVNTIQIKNDKLSGFNTDGKAALDAIEQKINVLNKIMVILGAGGSARSIAFEAKSRGAKIMILNRNKEKAIALAHEFSVFGGSLDELPSKYDILINTTPNSLPLPKENLCPRSVVMDINTLPKMSNLLKEAHAKQCSLVFGYEMFLNQALEQFKIWLSIDENLAKESLQKTIQLNL